MTIEQDQLDDQQLVPLRLIAGALVSGVVIFAAIAMFVGPAMSPPPAGGAPAAAPSTAVLLRMIWGAIAVMQIPMIFIVRRAIVQRAAVAYKTTSSVGSKMGALDDATMHPATFNAYRVATIVSLALAESLAIFGAVTLLLSGDALDLALVALPVLVMLAVFPTRDRCRRFAQNVQNLAAASRSA